METNRDDTVSRVMNALTPLGATRENSAERLLAVRVTPDKMKAAIVSLKELGVKHLSTITGLDAGDAIELDYQFWQGNRIIALKTSIAKTSTETETCVGVLPGAILYEMEVHDMFGVNFKGHPWMDRKLLLPDNYPPDLPPPLLKTTSSEQIRKAVGVEK